jgi:AcrR family transcriptional regulator
MLQLRLQQPPCTFLKDPQETKLGNAILERGIELMDEIGFEAFTFKKLGSVMGCPEASIYRYFESKQQLLLFLYSWYWGWMDHRIRLETNFQWSTSEKLDKAVSILISRVENDDQFPFINEEKLKCIIEHEGIKSLLTKKIDTVNQNGAFEHYKGLVEKLSHWVQELNPNFPFPNMLITTVIEGAHLQHFFIDHLPRLSNSTAASDSVTQFFNQVIHTFTRT